MSAAQKYIAPESKSRSLYIQPKLEVGAVNSPEEKEADAVAEKVMRMPSGKSLGMSGYSGSGSAMSGLGIQRTCSSCGEEKINRKAANAVSSAPVKSESLKEEKIGSSTQIQAKGNNNFAGGGVASSNLTASINATRGGGSPLNPSLSASMGGKMGADFSSVKVHTGEQSASFNNELNSIRAITLISELFLFSSIIYLQKNKKIKHTIPSLPIGVLLASCPITYAKCAQNLSAYSVHPSIDSINEAFVKDAHQRNLKVWVYTVDKPIDIDYCQAINVDGIFTNFPIKTREYLTLK